MFPYFRLELLRRESRYYTQELKEIRMQLYKNIIKKQKSRLIWSPILVFIFVVCETTQPYFMSRIIDEGIMLNNWQITIHIGISMILISIISLLANLANIYLSSKVAVQFGTDLRNLLFKHIQQFSLKETQHFQPSTLITRLTSDISLIQRLILMLLRIFLRAPLMLVFAFIFIIKINPGLTTIIGIAIFILVFLVGLIIHKAFPLFTKTQEKLDQLNKVIKENLNNIRVVKSFTREKHEIKKFNKSNESHRDTVIKAWDIMVFAYPMMQLIINASIIAVLWIGGNKVMSNSMQVGQLIAIINYFVQILSALMTLSFTMMSFARAVASSRRIKEVLSYSTSDDSTPETANDSSQAALKNGDITFNNIGIQYEKEEQPVLKEVSFKINKGETIAIVGPTGSGKSSLLNLIPRLYDPSEGEILINNQNIQSVPKNILRKQIGVVFQVNDLFTGTIAENLRWGKLDATKEELIQATQAAEIHNFIKQLEHGYETQLGRNGINLSGGQRQRICIARALLSQPEILLLDDCTSALDAETEIRIWENLKALPHQSTVLLVTQRVTTLNHVDRILILNEGGLSSYDTAENLLKESAYFKQLYTLQTQL